MASIESRAQRHNSAVTHRVVWRESGIKQQETFPTRSDAEKFEQLVEGSGNRWPNGWTPGAGFVPSPGDTASGSPLFRDWATTSIASRTAANDRTRADYVRDLTRNAFPLLGDIPLDEISRTDVAAWVTALRKAGLAEKTIRNIHGLVSSVMTEAVNEGLMPRSPTPGTLGKFEGVKTELMTFLTPAEYLLVLSHVSEHYKPLVMILAGTGMRWSEATALSCGAVDVWDRRAITITRAWKRDDAGLFYLGEPKTRRSRRTVSIGAEIVDSVIPLIASRDANDMLFTTKSGASRPVRHANFYNRVWLPAVAKARVCDRHLAEQCVNGRAPAVPLPCSCAGVLKKQPRIHDLRHSHVSWLIADNRPMAAISRRLGHASIVTTVDRYGHLLPEEDDRINAAIDRAMRQPADSVV